MQSLRQFDKSESTEKKKFILILMTLYGMIGYIQKDLKECLNVRIHTRIVNMLMIVTY